MVIERKIYSHMEQPFGAFCHAVRSGEWLYISGLTPNSTTAGQRDIVQQCEEVLQYMQALLEAEGGSFKNVLKVLVYVTEMDRLMDIHAVRHRYFGDALPASALVQVSGLVHPDYKIEIEAVARLGL